MFGRLLLAQVSGVAAPTFNLEISSDGGASWSPLASNQPVNQFGSGDFQWTIPASQPAGNNYLVRVTANDGLHPNDKGYAIMQPLVEQAIAAALKKK